MAFLLLHRVACAVAVAGFSCVVGCSGGSSSTATTTTGGGGNVTGATSVYVVQNPTSFGSGTGQLLRFSATSTGSVTPASSITGPTNTSFNGVATDGSGNVYSSYSGPTNVGGIVEYAASATGAATPLRTIPGNATTGVTAVDGLATSSGGEIFVGEDYGGIQAFSASANGSAAPARRILGAYETGGGLSTVGSAYAVAADGSDNVYVVNQGYTGGQPLLVFGPTATGNVAPLYSIGGSLTGMTTGSVFGVATDSAGNVYVTTYTTSGSGSTLTFTGTILEFAAGAKGNVAPIRTITGALTGLHAVAGIKVDSAGNIYVVSATTNVMFTAISPTVLKFSSTATGNVAPTASFTSTAWTFPDDTGSIAVF